MIHSWEGRFHHLTPLGSVPCAGAVEFARSEFGFEPDAVQARLLETESRRVMVNCSRQWGKTTVVAARAAWEAHSRPGSSVVVVSIGEKQAGEFVRKADGFLRRAGVVTHGDAGHRIACVLPNGSRILGMASTEARSRGFSATMLVLDEAARIPDSIYGAVLPMLAATDGSLWLVSTPNGTRGFFWEEWMRGEGWEKVAVAATECARIRPEFLEEMRRRRGEEHVRREYLCEFVAADDRLFDRGELEALIATDIPAFRGNFGLFSYERELVFGVDLGKLTDYSAIAVLERIPERSGLDPVTQALKFRMRNVVRHLERVRLGTAYPRVVERVRELVRVASRAGRCTVVVDATGVGEPVVDALRAAGLDGELVPVSITGGDRVTSGGGRWLVPKREVMVGMQAMVVRRELEIAADLAMRDELVEEMVGMGRSLRAEDGGHDDLVIAVGLAGWRVRSRGSVGERGSRLI